MTQKERPPLAPAAVVVVGATNSNSDALPHPPPKSKFSPRSSSARKALAAPQSLYSGRDRLGTIEQIADGWRAFDRAGRSLGVFDSRSEAIAAIGKRLRGAP